MVGLTCDLVTKEGQECEGRIVAASSPEIVELIGSRLAAGQTVAAPNQHFSDTLFLGASGTVSTLGGAAGLLVSAPTAVIDTDARDNHRERAHELSGNMFGGN